MRRILRLVVWLAALSLSAAGAAQAPASALCDAIAAQVRSNREITSGTSKADLMTTLKESHLFELPGKSDIDLTRGSRESDDEMSRFLTKLNPSNALRSALIDLVQFESAEVFSLPDSDTHVAISTGGTANCEHFLFFQTGKESQAQLLPDLPLKGERDGDNLICNGLGSEGYLARLNGAEVFLETYADGATNKYSFRVVPLQQGRWAAACTVQAAFRTTYTTDKVFVQKDGPLTKADLGTIAAQVVERHAAATDPKTFTFGPPLSDDQRAPGRLMMDLATKIENSQVPAFGAEKELAPAQSEMTDADSYPLVLDGKLYLLRVGHPHIAWRDFSDSIVILYTLKEGKLEPVGSAIVEPNRGPLEFLRATASR